MPFRAQFLKQFACGFLGDSGEQSACGLRVMQKNRKSAMCIHDRGCREIGIMNG